MTKTQVATHYSLRCKFKDANTVEVTVVNIDTQTTYQLKWTFADLAKKPQIEEVKSND